MNDRWQNQDIVHAVVLPALAAEIRDFEKKKIEFTETQARRMDLTDLPILMNHNEELGEVGHTIAYAVVETAPALARAEVVFAIKDEDSVHSALRNKLDYQRNALMNGAYRDVSLGHVYNVESVHNAGMHAASLTAPHTNDPYGDPGVVINKNAVEISVCYKGKRDGAHILEYVPCDKSLRRSTKTSIRRFCERYHYTSPPADIKRSSADWLQYIAHLSHEVQQRRRSLLERRVSGSYRASADATTINTPANELLRAMPWVFVAAESLAAPSLSSAVAESLVQALAVPQPTEKHLSVEPVREFLQSSLPTAPPQPIMSTPTTAPPVVEAATPMATDPVPAATTGNKSVSDVMPASSLTPDSDPLVVMSAFRAQLDASESARTAERAQLLAAQAHNEKIAAELAELKKRDEDRAKAEAAERDKKASEEAAAKKTQTDERKLKLEASLQAALERVQKLDPNAMKHEDLTGLTQDFHEELTAAGLDEQKIDRTVKRFAQIADIAVRASEGAAARAEESRRREMADHIAALSRQPLPPFTVSGSPVLATASSIAPPTMSHVQEDTPAPMMSSSTTSEYGVHNASVNNIFGNVLGKRKDESFASDSSKRTLVTETVGGSPAAAPAIDFKSPSWMLSVIAESNKTGLGMPGEELLRRGGAQVVTKHVASANGGTVLQRELQVRRSEPYMGPIGMAQLDPKNYEIALETIRAAFAPNGERPQARDMQSFVEEPSQFVQFRGPIDGEFQKLAVQYTY